MLLLALLNLQVQKHWKAIGRLVHWLVCFPHYKSSLFIDFLYILITYSKDTVILLQRGNRDMLEEAHMTTWVNKAVLSEENRPPFQFL